MHLCIDEKWPFSLSSVFPFVFLHFYVLCSPKGYTLYVIYQKLKDTFNSYCTFPYFFPVSHASLLYLSTKLLLSTFNYFPLTPLSCNVNKLCATSNLSYQTLLYLKLLFVISVFRNFCFAPLCCLLWVHYIGFNEHEFIMQTVLTVFVLAVIFDATSASRPRADVAYCIQAIAKRLAKTRNWAVCSC